MNPIFTRAVACAAAVVVLATPGTAVAAPPGDGAGQATARSFLPASPGRDGTASRPVPVRVPAQEKITSAAVKKFDQQGTTDFWLRFGDTPDLSAAYGIADWAARGQYVVDTLKAAAEQSQAGVVAELEAAGVSYETQWASNAILVHDGSLELATELAADAEVTQVRPTVTYAAPAPVEATPVQETADEGAPAGTLATGTPTSGISAVNADDLWAMGFTGQGIVVGGLDTGVSRANASIADSWRGASGGADYDWFDAARTGRTVPGDSDGHGTHTMGTMIGGTKYWNGESRRFGVAPGAEWIAANGCAGRCADTSLIRGGQWLLEPTRRDGSDPDPAMRPHVVNNSWGASFSTDPFMEDVVTAWEAAGIFAVFANGNDGEAGCESSGTPGSRSASYSVGAVTSGGTVAPFSSRGPGQSGAVKPDVTAPGVGVLSVTADGSMVKWDGTSMAAPHVAGAVALLWDAVPALVGDVQRTRALLDDGARDPSTSAALACGGTLDDNNVYGEGRLDVARSYQLAQSMEFSATQAPEITGTAKVGATLTAVADGAAWTPAATLTYQWYRGDQMISGATRSTYQLRPDDLGRRVKVAVLGRAPGYLPTEVDSAQTELVAKGTMNGSPWISGAVRVGGTLLAKAGTDYPSGARFRYQWRSDGAAISGATGFAYVPTSSRRGTEISVTVTASRKGYDDATTTVGGGTVGRGTFDPEQPYISGAAAPGATVYAKVPAWTPSASVLKYQWRLNGNAISGARGSSYRVQSWQKGKTLSVRVEGLRTGYATEASVSRGLVVGRAFSSSPSPRISGSKAVGRKLTASVGTWKPGPSGLSYQWYADGRPISGATGRSLALKGPQYGRRISVTVTARRYGYASTTRTSDRTSAIGRPAVGITSAENGWLVGWDSVPPGTYIAQAGTSSCVWERISSDFELLGQDFGYGQRILTLKPSDYAVWSDGCGDWRPYYAGMAERRRSTASDGVYVVGDHLERGTYVTAGPPSGGSCYYALLSATTGNVSRSHVIREARPTEPTTVTIPEGARAFETGGCAWTRVS
ncbi:S8 family serine peptidase [Myceligenerans crystallogenes]|uniref:Peptidase S8/S53 domain-containing protein n=1 Tax=Myceligenerans crystallogenes TaxID=316335 RepID=A0ABP4ZXU1_9MICO